MALYLIPVDIGFSTDGGIYSSYQKQIVFLIKHFIVENASTARKMLKKISYPFSFDDIVLIEYNEHNRHLPETMSEIRDVFSKNEDIGLMSEAGVPCIADPGHEVVRLAHEKNIKVVPMFGPSSIILALMASGFSGQQFVFHGYLPAKTNERQNKLKQLVKELQKSNYTHVFMEAPYRNNQMLMDILSIFPAEFELCVASEISLPDEFIKTQKISQWNKHTPDLHKKRCIFCVRK